MQIKRFEAADMTDALRLVKREFGADAVILSAKEIRPGGFFSALRKKSVEITAAIDCPVDKLRENSDFTGLLSEHLNSEVAPDRVSLSPPSPAAASFTQKKWPVLSPQTVSQKPHRQTDRRASMTNQEWFAQEVASEHMPTCGGMAGHGPSADALQNKPGHMLIAEPFYRDASVQKVIALVGPCGVGKSTTVAKLAWHCQVVEKKRVGLISLDRFRIASNEMLARVSCIMNLPLRIVHDTGQLKSALNDLSHVDVILIDTPGMSASDTSIMHDVRELLRIADADEIHLVANATVRDDVFKACVATFSPLGVNRLLLTHLDEHIGDARGLNLVQKGGLDSAFYSDGVDLSDGLHEYAADRAVGTSSHEEPTGGQVAPFSKKRGQVRTGSLNRDGNSDSVNYVANRNSELFHHPTCKSVKRINAENITAFNSIEHAIDEGFKPCRACCDIGMIRKPAEHGVGYLRARAI
jgi:flagellar biosynthesis protein FlhF